MRAAKCPAAAENSDRARTPTLEVEMPNQFSGRPRVHLTCAVCGATFVVKAYRAETARYCSHACHARQPTPENSRHGDARHGGGIAAEHQAWTSMKKRCFNPGTAGYRYYGGRSITVCDRWRDSYEDFLADVGRRPSPVHSLDRLDVNGHYEPGNVRWALPIEQGNNRRTNRLITVGGATHTMSEWARIAGLLPVTVHQRLRHGWSPERAVSTPSRGYRRVP